MEDKVIKKKSIIIISVIVVFFVIALFTRCSLVPSKAKNIEKVDKKTIKTNVKEIQALSDRDITEIKDKVKVMERIERASQIQAGNFNVIYDDSVILGDSHAEGFSVYGFINPARVAAVKGKSIRTCQDHIQQAINLNPSKVFINYGMNDFHYYKSDASAFAAKYKSVVQQIQSNIPNADIYVCSIIPAQPSAIAKQSYLAYSGDYNAALQAMCAELGINYIDITPLVKPEYYASDGIHTNKEFHRIWLNYVAENAGLLNIW